MNFTGTGSTHRGQLRANNEDSLLVDDQLGVYAVADGMGGCAAGELASRLAIEQVRRCVADGQGIRVAVASGRAPIGELINLAEWSTLVACGVVFERARRDPKLQGMGSTLTVLLTAGAHAVMAHVGDSRLYRIRRGMTTRLSRDHTLAEDMVRAGILSEERAKTHPFRHSLTRALGTTPTVDIDALALAVAPGDRYVLCSDGLSNYLANDDALTDLVPGTLEGSADALVDFANTAGGADNISVVVVEAPRVPVTAEPRRPVVWARR